MKVPAVFFLRVFLLLSIVDVTFCLLNGAVLYSFFILTFNILISYVISLLVKLFGHYCFIYKFVWYVIAFLMCCVDLFCVLNMNSRFGNGFASIIAGTNLSEAREFLSTFVNIDYVLILLAICLLFCFIPLTIKKIKTYFSIRILSIVWIFLLLFSICCVLRSPEVWKESVFGKMYMLYESANIPQLSDYEEEQELLIENKAQPSTIVIIIGESFSKSHSSLYGYEKDTNPKMKRLKDNGKLLVFNHVESPATYTTEAFKSMMSTYCPEYGDSVEWYKCPTIIGIAKQSGYHTTWVSNQCMTGMFENPIAEYAALCNASFFVGKQFAEMGDVSYDEAVFQHIGKRDSHEKKMLFVHLMGSHEVFKERFPEERVKFVEGNYEDFPSQQRQVLADYDNSVLYNDSIVSEIIKLYEEEEAVVLYYSDHALDLYESSPNYYGHSIQGNPISVKKGKQIPFMVYMSDRYKKRFPGIESSLQANIDTAFGTENLIYLLMDIMGVKFKLNDNVQKYTLLQ